VLATRPLRGHARIAWLGGQHEDVSCLEELFATDRRAVVSLTEIADELTHADLHELIELVDQTSKVEFICATSGWFDPSGAKPVEMRVLRALASIPGLTFGLVCSHRTGLLKVRGASICWDYSCGTPHFVPSVKVWDQHYTMPWHHLIGVVDWMARAKASRSLSPSTQWRDFGNGGRPVAQGAMGDQ
jgi:hypothetical protein